MWSHRWMSDDGFINLRIVDNVVGGHGPVFNVGERVEAGTSQLWLFVLVAARLVAGWAAPLEWLAVVIGIACSLGALAVTVTTQWRTWRGPVLPFAVLVWLPLSAVWDFSSSGLESSLLWLWCAACFGLLAVRAVAEERRRCAAPWWLPMLIGLGFLIRPDAGVYVLAFFAALVLLSDRAWRSVVTAVGWALGVPVAYEVFRMGYFGAMVPNTALAKEAASSNWALGGRYVVDVFAVGAVWVPVVVVLAGAVLVLRSGAVTKALRSLWLITWGCALLHALWVVRVGGDFMHARMLLPDLFLFILPLAAVPLELMRRPVLRLAAPVGMAAMALWCGAVWAVARPPTFSRYSDNVVDERSVYVRGAGVAHPVTIEDHHANEWTRWGEAARRRAASSQDVLLFPAWNRPMQTQRSDGGVFVVWPNIGLLGFAAGPRVHVVDPIGLSDPLASRMESLPGRRIGHSKDMPTAWVEARFAAPGASRDPASSDAARALACPPLQRLIDTVTAPLTPKQFAANVVRAPSLTLLHIPRDPRAATDDLC